MSIQRIMNIFFALLVVNSMLCANRDPFHLHEKEKKSKNSSHTFRLVGIISYRDTYGAVVATEEKQHIVFAGDRVDNTLIQEVSDQSITIIQGKKSKRLMLDEGK